MAVYKIFPDKDSFIFTEVSTANAGYDEMIEIGGYPIQEIGQTARTLIHFKNTEIQSVYRCNDNDFPYKIKLHIADLPHA